MSSLVATVPVSMDGRDVVTETEVSNKSVISVGSCKFRFVYHDGEVTAPLLENRANPTSARKVDGFTRYTLQPC